MYKIHIKNNHFGPDTFPNTADGEEVFTISRERFDAVAEDYSEVAKQLDVFSIGIPKIFRSRWL